MFNHMTRYFTGLCLALAASAAMAQAGVVQSFRGDAQSRVASGALTPLAVGQAVNPGTQLVTGAGGEAVVRFTDGHLLALKDNSMVGIAAYIYDRQTPSASSFAMELLRGGLRSVTGLLGKANPQAFRLSAATSTVGIRGSDWMAALEGDSLYTGVSSGGITVSNSIASALVDAGQFSATAGANAAPQIVTAAQLPAGIFGSLPQIQLAAGQGNGPGGSSAATSAASGSLSGTQLLIGAGLAGAAAAAAAGKGASGISGTSGTTGSTSQR